METGIRKKYPRTIHLPWSEGTTRNDLVLYSDSIFNDMTVVVTEKMDGENTTMYNDHVHARSIDSASHSSRDWMKSFWSNICRHIPIGWRICGENLYAKHSILYTELPSYFMGFNIWNAKDECLSWNETLRWFKDLNIVSVPLLFEGIYSRNYIKKLIPISELKYREGYVIRNKEQFSCSDFKMNVAKYVRSGHIADNQRHWSTAWITKNRLKESSRAAPLPR